jgi:hypothetical protein
MQVTTVGTSTFPDTTSVSGRAVSLTPDELFEYCETQMNEIDTQANGYFARSEQNNQAQQTLSDVMSKVRELQTKMQNGQVTTDELPALESELATAQTQYPADSDTLQSAIAVLKTGNDKILSNDDAQKILDTLSSVNTDIGSDNQMAMIHLQSAMSNREQVIQLTTNILQTMNDSESKVLGNIHS